MSDRVVIAVDVGSYTVLAAAGRERDGRLEVLEDRQWFARLGEGVRAAGRLRPEAIARAVEALREARGMARRHGAEIAAVATRACREAANVDEFLEAAQGALGTAVEVVSGEREAELTFRGAASGLDVAGPATYVDVGGGSTEVIDALGPTARASASLPLGAAALTEAWLRGDPYGSDELARARDHARRELAALAVPLRPVVVAIGGTATTFVAVERGMERYDGARVHGSRLSRAALEAAVARLAALRAAERRGVAGLAPERAPVIVAGGLVLAAVLAAAGAPETTVSDRGVRHGVLLDRLRRRG